MHRLRVVAPWSALLVVALLPVIVGAWHRHQQGWYPESDEATIVLLSDDVLRGDPPLVGMISTGGAHLSDPELHHPGPLELYLIAPLSTLLGPALGSSSTAVLVSTLSVLGIVAGLRSLGGSRLAAGGLVTSAAILWGIGSDAPTSVWNPYVVVMPFACFLVLAVASVARRPWAVVGFVASGSLVAQTHLSYAGLVATLVAWVAVVTGWRLARHRGHEDPRRRIEARQAAAAAVLGFVLWLPPLVDQVSGEPGNLRQIWRSLTGPSGDAVGAAGLGELSRVVGVPLVGLRPRGELIRVLPGVEVVDLVPTAVLVAALVGVCLAAGRRDRCVDLPGSDRAAASTMLVAVGAGLVTAVRIPLSDGVQYQYYGLWMWPLAAIAWTFLAWSCWRLAPNVVRGAALARRVRRFVPVLALPAVLAISAMPRPAAWEPWAAYRRTAGSVAPPAAVDGLDGGPVLVRFRGATPYLSSGSAVVLSLAAAGHEVLVDPGAPTPVFPWREPRRYLGQPVSAEIWVVGGSALVDVPEGAEVLARSTILSPSEQADVEARFSELSASLAGSVAPGPRSPRGPDESSHVSAAVADPVAALENGELAALAARGLVEVDGIGPDALLTLDRMHSLSTEEEVVVYLVRSQR